MQGALWVSCSSDTGFAMEAKSVSFAVLDFIFVSVFWLRRLLSETELWWRARETECFFLRVEPEPSTKKQDLFLHLSEIANKEHQVRGPRPRNRQRKNAGGRQRCFFLVPLCRCVFACPSVCFGSSGPCWAVVCRVGCLVSCCFRGASFLVGAVPKSGNDILGISLPRPRLRAWFYRGYMAFASLLIKVGCLKLQES